MLLELSGAWGHSAFLQSPASIDPQLGRAIVRRVEAAGMRIAAIRRHGRRPDHTAMAVVRGAVRCGQRGAVLRRGKRSSRVPATLRSTEPMATLSTDPLVAVCAHGKHDQCCAVRGRGATAAIAAEYPEITWECSHLGGDRFAATMLVLPEGLCYGRVDSTESADLVRLYLDGRLDNRFLRGRTSLPHAVQAAQYFAREAYGDDRIASLSPLDVERSEGKTSRGAQRRLGAHRGQPQGGNVRAAAVAMSCDGPRPGPDLHPRFDHIGMTRNGNDAWRTGSGRGRLRPSDAHRVAGNDIGDGDEARRVVALQLV